jgi:L-aspartate oxidase
MPKSSSVAQALTADVLVIGSGLAGLTFALKVADQADVLIVSKGEATHTNTDWAQGGIATVSSQELSAQPDLDDSFESHIQDTLIAGAGLCRKEIVEMIVEQGPARIADLQKWGVNFEPSLHREAGHSHRRIFHVQDHTGQAILRQLLSVARKHPRIRFLENTHVVDLITSRKVHDKHSTWPDIGPTLCYGAYLLDARTEQVQVVTARATVLATGGAGKVYLYTSNWNGATGDGVALAFRAGARVANLEFMQFHPTCLYHPAARNFLITEAIRGDGGILINSDGEDFMKACHPDGSLAPRDIVARGIDAEMKRSGQSCVYLDARPDRVKDFERKFPVIFARCLELGIDPRKVPIPVVPAAHYLCGGVLVDRRGATDIAGLYAAGEVTCTGLHGANRLASNSLLECLAFGHNAAEDFLSSEGHSPGVDTHPEIPPWVSTQRRDSDEMVVISHMWDEIRRLMWNYVGIQRSNKRLERARNRLKTIQQEVLEYYWDLKLHPDILELRNLSLVASLSIECALRRKESRGIHYNIDYPETLSEAKNTVINPERTFI